MDQTTNLKLPFIMPAQAQKHVTHNEALQVLDAIVQLSVASQQSISPPSTPPQGARYIVAPGAENEWQNRDGQIAAFQDGAWTYYQPQTGWLAWVEDESSLFVWTGNNWEVAAGNADGAAATNEFSELGINTTPDDVNKLSVKSDRVLFSHDDVTSGNGSISHTLNKQDENHSAGLLFQSAFSGHAEIGLLGDNNLTVKVGENGTSLKDALIIDNNDGIVAFPAMSNGPRPIYTYHENSSANVGNWYSIFEWQMDGNFRVVSAILDITHRNSLRHHELKLLFEFSENTGVPRFTRLLMDAFGDPFADGDKFKIVANHSTQKCTLYVTRSAGHFPIRYMSFRHHQYHESTTVFNKLNTSFGTTEPSGDMEVIVGGV